MPVVFVLALTVKVWLKLIFDVVNKLVGWVPLVGGWIEKGEAHVLSGLNVVVVKSRGAMGACLDGIRWSIREFGTGVRDFADYVENNWEQLVANALPTSLKVLYSAAAALYRSVDNRVDSLAGTVANVGPSIRKAADAAEARAVNAASSYADSLYTRAHDFTVSRVNALRLDLAGDIAAATDAAESYADRIVGSLRHAEDAAIEAATATAAAALEQVKSDVLGRLAGVAAGLTALRATLEGELADLGREEAAAITGAVSALAGAISAAEQAAESAASSALNAEAHTLEAAIAEAAGAAGAALAAARTALEGELTGAIAAAGADLHAIAAALEAGTATVAADARAIAVQLQAAEAAAAGELTNIYNLPADALRDLLDRIDLTKVAGFGAGLVLVRGLVNAIAREAGLDSAQCRAKHKDVCGMGGDEWGDLLAGGVFLTGALSLAELVKPARIAVHELADLMRQAA